ncbi:SDR family NAD(P)-dependent oxidoreductase [Sphingomonas naphthae]|uniref:SDR family NAD(P)-dependent oxidoreductase n=1 Tax=Sphingomonas naphthae TaxID=1813468 RepID=A0ABY7TNM0_9SPHN|nr:SDR family NAD(P)-dependent oxidoreductase [Sphingomonas naphthae]WCT74520.1 SDR family NAD(P)-dependent oxidoreductase [Sphingomonas naphthae]
MELQHKLAGQCAIVTGAARGLGRAYALRLASLGADVAILDADLRSFEAFEQEKSAMTADTAMAEVEAMGCRSVGIEVDVTQPDLVTAAVTQVAETFGRVDIVVCNAGGGMGGLAETGGSVLEDEVLDAVIRRNLYGTMYTCRAAATIMKAQRSGRIVTTSSLAAKRPEMGGGYAHYGAAKGGIEAYTRYLAQELGPFGITANCIAPGIIRTGRTAPIHDALGSDTKSKISLQRFGTPDDCAGVIEFLVTDLGSYVSGALIPIDGGLF